MTRSQKFSAIVALVVAVLVAGCSSEGGKTPEPKEVTTTATATKTVTAQPSSATATTSPSASESASETSSQAEASPTTMPPTPEPIAEADCPTGHVKSENFCHPKGDTFTYTPTDDRWVTGTWQSTCPTGTKVALRYIEFDKRRIGIQSDCQTGKHKIYLPGQPLNSMLIIRTGDEIWVEILKDDEDAYRLSMKDNSTNAYLVRPNS